MRHEIIDASQLELTDKVVSIKRKLRSPKVANTMRFTALVVVGDMNGHVGVGLGKAKEIPEAIRKGKEDANQEAGKPLLETKTIVSRTITWANSEVLPYCSRDPRKVPVSSPEARLVPL